MQLCISFKKAVLGAQGSKLMVSRPLCVPSEAASPVVQPGCPTGQFPGVSGRPSQALLVNGLVASMADWPWRLLFSPWP